jgi:type VI secretion system protein ImpM
MSAASVGFFGKLPSHGDFIERRVPEHFRETWDAWLQRCIAESQRTLGTNWLDCYLTGPVWRFVLSDGVAGDSGFAGVLMPSVDRVGRYFPFTVVVELPTNISPLQFAQLADPWFVHVERLCTDALQEGDFDLATFDEELLATAARLGGLDRLTSDPVFPGTSPQWRWPIRSAKEMPAGLGALLIAGAQRALRPLTLWWTDGSDHVQPSALLVQALPQPASFAALLAGTWADGHWDGQVVAPPDADVLAAPVSYRIASAGATDTGAVRTQNQDSFALNDGSRVWAVADGMGGHSRGDLASQMVVDALSAVEPTATLNSAMDGVRVALERVNADLRRSALQVTELDTSGSTVVVLVIRGSQWGVSWAGDSRAYLYRSGELVQLTQDHSAAEAVAGEGADSLIGLVSVSNAITRAVGGEDELRLDQAADTVAVGDRFLLCSDGLYRVLDAPSIISCMTLVGTEEVSRALIEAARAAAPDDNVTAVIVDVLAES